MKTPLRIAAVASALIALPLFAASTVTIAFDHPEKFTDIKADALDDGAGRPATLKQLEAAFRETLSAQLKDGERLQVTFTNIDLAGDYREGTQVGTERVRLINQHYAPRLTFDFILADAAGKIAAEGHRELMDPDFLNSVSSKDRDAYRFENQLLQRWARKELKDL